MQTELSPAFVLHHRPYRETSLLVEIFSSCEGRIAAIAKGANRPRSPLRGVLQPFRSLLIAWVGRGEVATLTRAEVDGPPVMLVGRKLLSGFYMNEVLMRVLHRHDAHPKLFQGYQKSLKELSEADNEEPVLRVFEKRLLDEIGYGLVLDHDVDSGTPIDPDRNYYYQRDKGPWQTVPESTPTLKVRGQTLIALAREHIHEPEHLREAKQLMRFALKPHLGDKPLMSRELFIKSGGG
jgi:DNA repair protein RecO (recombination protein O)